MSLIISGKNFKLTPGLKAYVEKHVTKITKFAPHPIKEVKAELDHDHNQQTGLVYRVELSILAGGKIFKAGQKAKHMLEAIDLCLPKLISQLKKYKSKRLQSRQPGQTTFRY